MQKSKVKLKITYLASLKVTMGSAAGSSAAAAAFAAAVVYYVPLLTILMVYLDYITLN